VYVVVAVIVSVFYAKYTRVIYSLFFIRQRYSVKLAQTRPFPLSSASEMKRHDNLMLLIFCNFHNSARKESAALNWRVGE